MELPVRNVAFSVGDRHRVSGLLCDPPGARACLVLAHGAGAGMLHPTMEAVATSLAARQVATLRYNFPFMEQGGKRPDPPALAHAAVRAAVAGASGLVPHLPLIAGGRSFGGRMTSQAQALSPLPGVKGLAFLAYPLHPAGRVSADRAAHLAEVRVPMLFLQGSADALAEIATLRSVVSGLGPLADLRVFEAADHAFHVPARSGRTDAAVRLEMLDALAMWVFGTTSTQSG